MLLTEYLDLRYKVEKLTYAFHYQQKDGKLIFRYDNASKRRRLILLYIVFYFKQLVHKRRKKMDVTRFWNGQHISENWLWISFLV